MAETTKTGGVATEQQAREMRASKFGTFNAEEVKKKEDVPSISVVDKSLINHGLIKVYNQKVKKKTEKAVETINHERFLQICEAFNIPDEVKLAYTNRKALFTSQSDDLILYFSSLKPTEVGEVPVKSKRLIIAGAVQNVLFDLYDEVIDLPPSKIGVNLLTLLMPIDAIKLGINPLRDRLSNINIKAVEYIFDAIANKKKTA